MKVTVLGSGGWGTALALLLLENGNDVTLWSYSEEESKKLRETRVNPLLPDVEIPEEMHFSTDMSCVKGCGAVVMATPSFAVRSTAAQLRELADEGMTMVIVTHEMGFAREVANRVLFMDGGKIAEQGSPAEIFENPQNPRTRQFLKAVL